MRPRAAHTCAAAIIFACVEMYSKGTLFYACACVEQHTFTIQDKLTQSRYIRFQDTGCFVVHTSIHRVSSVMNLIVVPNPHFCESLIYSIYTLYPNLQSYGTRLIAIVAVWKHTLRFATNYTIFHNSIVDSSNNFPVQLHVCIHTTMWNTLWFELALIASGTFEVQVEYLAPQSVYSFTRGS